MNLLWIKRSTSALREGLISRACAMLLVGMGFWAAPAAGADFSLMDLRGERHQLSDYRGKWVVVNYWATWCPPCLEEIPELVEFHDRHRKTDGVVLGVNLEQIDRATLRQFVDDHAITYPVLLGHSPGSQLGPVPGLPTTYLVSPEGRVMARNTGPVTREMLERFIGGPPAHRPIRTRY